MNQNYSENGTKNTIMLGGTLKYCQLWKLIFNLEIALNILCLVWYMIMSQSYMCVIYKTKCIIPTNKELLLLLIVYWKVGESALSLEHYMTYICKYIWSDIEKNSKVLIYIFQKCKKIQECYNNNVDYLESLY